MSEQLEGKQCIISALRARQRRFELVLVSWSAHRSKTEEVIQLANQLGVPVKTCSPDELDRMSKGKTHAGLVAIASAKPIKEVGTALTKERFGHTLNWSCSAAWATGRNGSGKGKVRTRDTRLVLRSEITERS